MAEKALFAFPPIRRTVPTTSTRMTSITAYSAMSCPRSSSQSSCHGLTIHHFPVFEWSSKEMRTTNENVGIRVGDSSGTPRPMSELAGAHPE